MSLVPEPIEVTLARIDTRVEALGTSVAALTRAVQGNGEDGLRLEVDRLKVADTRRAWFERVVLGGFLLIASASLAAVGAREWVDYRQGGGPSTTVEGVDAE